MSLRSIARKLVVRLLPIYHKLLVWRLRHKKVINVVFFAASVSMWRYQFLYKLMSKHPKFRTHIVILPMATYAKEQQSIDVKDLKSYFDSKGMTYVLGQDPYGNFFDLKKEVDPDVLFYPQPYYGCYPDKLAYNSFIDKLICYYPYAFWTAGSEWSYDLTFQNIAWKLFYSTKLHKQDAINLSLQKGKNVEVVGYPNADTFIREKFIDLWVSHSTRKKRVIWAPHFTITNGWLYQSNFLWMADLMLELANRYSDQIQFAFKPHPRLYTELCNHSDWGEEKARQYYEQWTTMENTQIETGEFVDLFMTSDAMIHDCGSFSVEYHYSENPVMYVATDFEKQVEEKNEFGKIAMRQHYVGKCEEDIVNFIEDVVLAGNDPMKEGRVQFKKDYLLPPNGKTVAENTMDVFLKAFC